MTKEIFYLLSDIIFPYNNIQISKAQTSGKAADLFHPHVHDSWEIKIFTDVPQIILIPPEIAHSRTSLHRWAYCTSLLLKQPWVEVLIPDKEKHKEKLLPFAAADALCPGGILEIPELIQNLMAKDTSSASLETVINNLIKLMLCAVETVLNNNEYSNEFLFSSITERAKNYIDRYYYSSELTVEDVARYVMVSPGHLANLFQQEKLGTVRQFIIKTRLNNALKLLKSGLYTVKDVSEITGWNSSFYFSNKFQKYFNKRPSEIFSLPHRTPEIETEAE